MHYLDNSASTKVLSHVAQTAYDVMTQDFANPSSLHPFGYSVSKILENSRETFAKTMQVQTNEIIFTSGGSESINTAIKGAAYKMSRRGKHIISTTIEHSATLKTLKSLEEQGFLVTYINPDNNGNISANDILQNLRNDTILVTCMYVNNETGAILPIYEIGKILKNHMALFHVDAVQAYGKIPVEPKKILCDMLSISGHKIGATKGIGALYIRRDLNISPLIYGGGQEFGIRSGTENMPGIAAISTCGKYRCENMVKNHNHVCMLKQYLMDNLNFNEIIINSYDGLEYITNFSVMGCKSEVMLRILGDMGVFVSSGSACSKGKASHVLKAMNLSQSRIDSALRVSFCPENNKDDIDALIEGIYKGIKTLRR